MPSSRSRWIPVGHTKFLLADGSTIFHWQWIEKSKEEDGGRASEKKMANNLRGGYDFLTHFNARRSNSNDVPAHVWNSKGRPIGNWAIPIQYFWRSMGQCYPYWRLVHCFKAKRNRRRIHDKLNPSIFFEPSNNMMIVFRDIAKVSRAVAKEITARDGLDVVCTSITMCLCSFKLRLCICQWNFHNRN